jgi:hypothetical protein
MSPPELNFVKRHQYLVFVREFLRQENPSLLDPLNNLSLERV